MKWPRNKEEQERAVIADASRGLPVRAISERRGLPPERVRDLIDKREPLEDIVTPNIRTEIERHLGFLNGAIEDYQQIYEQADDDTLRLRALNGRMATLRERFETLKQFGALPIDPTLWQRIAWDEPVMQQLFNELRDRGVEEQILNEAADAVDQQSSIAAALAASNKRTENAETRPPKRKRRQAG